METIYHGRRYWVQEPTGSQHVGWNTRFEPCRVLKYTAKRIYIESPTFGQLNLNRHLFELEGKVYHTTVHEFFYKEIPAVDPEKHADTGGWKEFLAHQSVDRQALATLGLKPGCSREDIKRAYKQKARNCHPDSGGSHDAFIKLKQAYESAMNQL